MEYSGRADYDRYTESFGMLGPIDVSRYEAKFQEIIRAQKERRRWSFEALQDVERIQITARDFIKLDKTLGSSELDYRWPSISFNARTCTGIIQWMPLSPHETLAASFIRSDAIVSQSLRPDVVKQMQVVGGQKVSAFKRAYSGSRKEPDVLFKYRQQNRDVSYSAVVEVGLAETYKELVEDVKLWIEGNDDIRTAILIKIVEDPEYRSPTRNLGDDQIVGLGFPHYDDLKPSMVVLEDPNDGYGPLQLNGLTWVGKMTMFLEIWKRDETTGDAKRRGPRMHFVPNDGVTELNLKVSDFYPIDATDGGDTRFPLTFDQLRLHLEMAREELAVLRCNEMLFQLAKRQNNVDDGDYTP